MNQLVARWQVHERNRKPDTPDSAAIGEVKLLLQEEKMIQKELPDNQFASVIRMVNSADRERVLALRNATFNTLKRLKLRRDATKAVTNLPAGSDHVDLMSLYVWLSKVEAADKAAVEQVVKIDATAVSRTGV